jgi:hypothetical protein
LKNEKWKVSKYHKRKQLHEIDRALFKNLKLDKTNVSVIEINGNAKTPNRIFQNLRLMIPATVPDITENKKWTKRIFLNDHRGSRLICSIGFLKNHIRNTTLFFVLYWRLLKKLIA